jgi:hypothetical protein
MSTPDIVTTPDSTGLTAFDFHIEDKEISGPMGPSLFGPPVTSSRKPSMEATKLSSETPVSAAGPFHYRASKIDPLRRDTPVPNRVAADTPQPQYVSHAERASAADSAIAQDWSPRDVVQWMRNLGFEDDIVEKFYYNDISGSILLELQSEDLKELDIMSFGKRHRVMSSIQSLRSTTSLSSTAPSSSRSSSVSNDVTSTLCTSTVTSNSSHRSCSATDDNMPIQKPRRRRQHSNPATAKKGDIGPGDSVSIVAIEQLLPKLHHCSKGENCRKWQKQQAKLSSMVDGLPVDSYGRRAIVTGDPGNPKTAPNLLKSPTKSDITPSVVASSDAMGPEQTQAFQLSRERLKEVESQNPQQNVIQFLKLQNQGLSKLQTVNDPSTPPRDFLPSPGSGSPDSAKITPTLAEKIGQLPRLEIPCIHDPADSAFSGAMSAQKTVTPSILSKRGHIHAYDTTAVPGSQYSALRDTVASPADFYRLDPSYRIETETPFSETDAPVTAIPIGSMGPVAREVSQSVPPNMRFGNNRFAMAETMIRPSSTKAENHRRYPSIHGVATMNPLKEGQTLSPIETPDDLRNTPRAPHCRSNNLFTTDPSEQDNVKHKGWMRKRKTNKFFIPEWHPAFYKLEGTELTEHRNEQEDTPLDYIDVDDYAVACSSLASGSKLSAAFKKRILKRKDNVAQESAFAFSLVPAAEGSTTGVDRKMLFLNGPKSHHFTVDTRDERIDWMRELMLARAVKRGRESGAAININGTLI